jgi:hypothetical protein
MRKIGIVVITFIVISGAAATVVFFMFFKNEQTFHIGKNQIQQAVNLKIPVTKPLNSRLDLTVKDMEVLLEAGRDQIGAAADIDLIVKIGPNPKTLSGFVKAWTGIRYDQSEHCFYLRNPEIEELNIDGIPVPLTKIVPTAVKPVMTALILEVPFFVIKDDNLKMQLAKAVLKDVKVSDGAVTVTLGY